MRLCYENIILLLLVCNKKLQLARDSRGSSNHVSGTCWGSREARASEMGGPSKTLVPLEKPYLGIFFLERKIRRGRERNREALRSLIFSARALLGFPPPSPRLGVFLGGRCRKVLQTVGSPRRWRLSVGYEVEKPDPPLFSTAWSGRRWRTSWRPPAAPCSSFSWR